MDIPDSEDGAGLIAIERNRQITEENWDDGHDDEHDQGQMADAAACYAINPRNREMAKWHPTRGRPAHWPWDDEWWKPCPDDRIHELVKAGALIAAEIDRLLRGCDSR